MSKDDDLILYDLPSKPPCRSWSDNVWKIRLVLNYKHIPYRTQWVPFPSVQSTVSATGVAPNPSGSWTEYSVPLVKLPDGTYIMDSAKIAPELEKLHPNPPLHLDLGIHNEVLEVLAKALDPLFPSVGIPEIGRWIVPEEDRGWFYEDRRGKLGASLDELEKDDLQNKAWEESKPGFEAIRRVMNKHKRDSGPFILGSEPSYGDFILVAGIHLFSFFPKGKFEKFLGMCEPELRNLYDASQEWLKRDD